MTQRDKFLRQIEAVLEEFAHTARDIQCRELAFILDMAAMAASHEQQGVTESKRLIQQRH